MASGGISKKGIIVQRRAALSSISDEQPIVYCILHIVDYVKNFN